MLKVLSMIILCLTLCSPFFFDAEQNVAKAVSASEMQVSDDNFSLQMQAFNKYSSTLTAQKKESVDVSGEKIDYFYFNWSEIKYLTATMNFSPKQNYQFTKMQLKVSYRQTEDWTQNVIAPETASSKSEIVLYEKDFTTTNIPSSRLLYYINADGTETSEKKFGYGFGIYKFDFLYNYIEQENVYEKSIGSIYVAIVPDDIDSINSSIHLKHTVSSSNELLNIYNVYIDSELYNYVNPIYVTWFVEGVDQNNLKYVLTKDDCSGSFATYTPVWESLDKNLRTGTSFIFDSNNIEADWKISCIILNSDGSVKTSSSIDVTTIKEKTVSYFWLILLSVMVGLILIGSIVLIIILKKKEKIW